MATIEFPNSPGIPVEVTRGATDPITGEALSDQFVWFTWEIHYTETVVDPETGENTEVDRVRIERKGFLGP